MSANIDLEFEFYINNDFSGLKDNTWIAIYKQKVVSSGEKLHDVITSVKEQSIPISKVLITKIKQTARYL